MYGFRAKGDHMQYYLTAYGVAVKNGFEGTEQEWLTSIIGPAGPTGKNAFEYAKEAGWPGTEEEFAIHLATAAKSAYEYALEAGWVGTEREFSKKMGDTPILVLNGVVPNPDGTFTLTPQIVGALPISGGKLTGPVIVLPPEADGNPVTLKYLREKYLALTGGRVTGKITAAGGLDMESKPLTNLKDPVNDKDAATKKHADNAAKNAVNGAWVTQTISVTGWSGKTVTVPCPGMTAGAKVVKISPAPPFANQMLAAENFVVPQTQGNGTLTFQCESVPSGPVKMNVAIYKGA